MTWGFPALCFLFDVSSIQPCMPDCMLQSHTQSREGQTSSQGGCRGLSGGLCCAKWTVQKRKKRKRSTHKKLHASSSTFGRVTTSQGNGTESGQKWASWVRPSFLPYLSRVWTQLYCVKSQMNVCMGYRPPPSSSFILMIPLLLIMTKHFSLWAAPLFIELKQLPLSTNLKTKRKIRIKRQALCCLYSAQNWAALLWVQTVGLLKERGHSSWRVGNMKL